MNLPAKLTKEKRNLKDMIMEAKAFKIPTLTELMKGVRTKRQRSADCNKKLMKVRLNYSGGKNRHNSFEVKTYKKL